MAAGLKILNDHDTYQIDENYQNFMLKQKINVTLGASSNWQNKTITFAGSPSAICAIRLSVPADPNSGPCAAVKKSIYANGTWTVDLMCINVTGASHTIIAYIFDVGVPQSDSFGLAVWNADAELVFHSSGKPLRITDFDSTKTMALVQNTIGIARLPSSDMVSGMIWRLANIIRANDVSSMRVFMTTTVSRPDGSITEPTYILIDVTGH